MILAEIQRLSWRTTSWLGIARYLGRAPCIVRTYYIQAEVDENGDDHEDDRMTCTWDATKKQCGLITGNNICKSLEVAYNPSGSPTLLH